MSPGDLVKLADLGTPGRVIEILPSGNVVVRWSSGVVSAVPPGKLEPR